jgi:hypothetical protein
VSRNAAVALLIRRQIPDPSVRAELLDMLGLLDGNRIAPDDLRTITFTSLNGSLGLPSMADERDRAARSTAPPLLRVLPPPLRDPKPADRKVRRAAVVKPCGTEAAAKRHTRNKEPLCELCEAGRLERNANLKRPVPPCGTAAAYQRHRRRKETACEPCRQANVEYRRKQRGGGAFKRAECGSTAAYQAHLRRGEQACDPCRLAANAKRQALRAAKRDDKPQQPAPEKQDRRRPRPACGTTGGYRAHLTRDEPVCDECREAERLSGLRRRRAKAAAEGRTVNSYGPSRCGTESGRSMHRRRGEEPCQPCRDAFNAAQAARRKSRAKAAA